MGYIIILLILVIVILAVCLSNKHKVEQEELFDYNCKLATAKDRLNKLDNEYQVQRSLCGEAEKRYKWLLEQQETITKNHDNLQQYFSAQELKLQDEFDNNINQQFQDSLALLQVLVQEERVKTNNKILEINSSIEGYQQQQASIAQETEMLQQRYDSLLAPLQQYEKDRQQKLFFTIQIPEEYRDDINFLLVDVSKKIQHPDVINKLIWTEYVKPQIEETFKRVGIKDEPGIYKLTNIDNGKSYIGKSTNIKKRITDHFKSAIGIKSIADQAVHHAILNDGLWNWSIEYVTYCDKDSLNEMEKYYIEFFKSQEWGYNKNQGGGG